MLEAPDGATISDTTGEISWTPAADQLGQQAIVIEVSDGFGGAATQAFSVLVGDGIVNLPPQLNSEAPRFTAVGSDYEYQIVATDPEGTALSYAVSRGPNGLTVDTNGQVTWTPGANQTGQFVVTLVVTDADGASTVESFELDVLAENRAPVVNSLAPSELFAGEQFQYDLLVTDADAYPLQFELISGPDGASIDVFGRLRWATNNDLIGTHDFEVRVTDPRGGETTQSFTLNVVADTVAPILLLSDLNNEDGRNILPWQGPIRVFARATDNVGIASLTLTANGVDIPLDANGTVEFTFEEYGFRNINVVATAVDVNGNVTTRSTDVDFDFPEGFTGADGEVLPTAIITSPEDSSTTTGLVSIVGTATHEAFAAYELLYRRVDQSESEFVTILQSETAVENGELGVWDTSLLRNDEYVIRLQVATNTGVVNVAEHNVGLAGELKLGNFQLQFTDMVIPVAGIPIEITRVYDTLDADVEGEFGFGWRLEFRDTNLQVGLPESGLEDIGIFPAFRPGVKVYLNIPGQGRQGFTFDPDIKVLPGLGGDDLVVARPRFTPDPGVTSTLSTGVNGFLQVNEFGELFAPGNVPYNPASADFGGGFELTTSDGIQYRINGANGLLDSATDRNGNTLTFSEAGITSELSNVELVFNRDSSGRIVSISNGTDSPFRYEYNNGDLVSTFDQAGNESTFTYDDTHKVISYVDPEGTLQQRTEYGEDGRILSRTDSTGRTIEFNFDPNTRQEVLKDANDAVTVLEYDNRGNVVTITNAVGDFVRQKFDAQNNLIEAIDSAGVTVTQTFDASGNLTTRTEGNGATTQFTYAQGDRLTSVTDALGNVLEFKYDSDGNLIQRVDALGNTIVRREVNDRGLIVSQSDAIGSTETFEYDQAGNQTAFVDSNGNRISQTYDAYGVPIQFVSGTGVTYDFSPDARGYYTSASSSAGGSATFDFNSNGNLQSIENANGDRSFELLLDGEGKELEFVGSLGGRTQNVFDTVGNRIQAINENGDISSFEYDQIGRLIGTESPDGGVTNRVYDENGRLSEITNQIGGVTKIEYDATGQVIAQTNAIGNTVRFERDLLGRVTKTIDPSGGVTETIYNEFGQVVGTIFADGTRVSQDFNQLGQLTSQTDPLGQTTFFEYDSVGNLTGVIEPNGSTTRFKYNQDNQLVEQRDSLGRATQLVYDSAGRLTDRVYPDGSKTTIAYDAAGFVTSTTDGNGEQTIVTQDADGRVTQRVFADGTSETFEYSARGELLVSTNSSGSTVYDYDTSGRLAEVAFPNGSTVQYKYDLAGNRTSVSYELPNGEIRETQFTYDVGGRLLSVTDSDGNSADYEYDTRNNVVQIDYSNGVSGQFTYDALNRLEQIEYLRDAETIAGIRYVTDAAGQRAEALLNDGRRIQYRYDERGFLISEVHSDELGSTLYQEFLTYDAVGNVISTFDGSIETAFVYNDLDQLVSEGDVSYEYDDNGQLTSRTDGTTVTTYRYDAEGQLIETIVDSVVTNYQYDANGVRLSQISGDENTLFVSDLVDLSGVSQILATYDAASEASVHYVFGDRPISQTDTDSGTSFLLQDGSRNVVAVTSSTGEVQSTVVYAAFGSVLATTGTTTSELGFAGEFGESDGLIYLRARYYDPASGRFLSRDPLFGQPNEPVTLHRYLYGNNNPITNIDPTGEAPFNLTEVQVSIAINTTVGASFSFVSGLASGKRGLALFTETVIGGAFGAFGGAYGTAIAEAFTTSKVVAQALRHPKVAQFAGRIAYAIPPTFVGLTEDISKGIASGDIRGNGFVSGLFFGTTVNFFSNVLLGPGAVSVSEIRGLGGTARTGFSEVVDGVDVYTILTRAERAAAQFDIDNALTGVFTTVLDSNGLDAGEEILLNFLFEVSKILFGAATSD